MKIFSTKTLRSGLFLFPAIVVTLLLNRFVLLPIFGSLIFKLFFGFILSIFIIGFWTTRIKEKLLREDIQILDNALTAGFKINLYSLWPAFILGLSLMALGLVFGLIFSPAMENIKEMISRPAGRFFLAIVIAIVYLLIEVLSKGSALQRLYSRR